MGKRASRTIVKPAETFFVETLDAIEEEIIYDGHFSYIVSQYFWKRMPVCKTYLYTASWTVGEIPLGKYS